MDTSSKLAICKYYLLLIETKLWFWILQILLCITMLFLIGVLIHKLKEILFKKNYFIISLYSGTYVAKILIYTYYFWIITD